MIATHAPELEERRARAAGLRSYVTPSLEAVERRRVQLWTITFFVVGLVAAGLALLSVADATLDGRVGPVDPSAFRIALLGVTLAFCAYVGEKEVLLRRMARALTDERVLSAALTNRLQERTALAAAASAVNRSLALDDTLTVILSQAVALLNGSGGAVYLRDGADMLAVVASAGEDAPERGSRVPAGSGAVGRAAMDGLAVLADINDSEVRDEARAVAMAVPLVHRDEIEGVLLVHAGDEPFGDYDLQIVSLFAESAATAIANARMYESERRHVADLLQLDKMKSRFVALVTHELRSPTMAIAGAVRTLRRHDLPREHVVQFLDLIERQSVRLGRLVDDVLSLKRAEIIEGAGNDPVDVGEVAREVVRLSRLAGRPAELTVDPEPMIMHGDPHAVEQILTNLVDNAFTHGWGAVEVTVTRKGDTAELRVRDRGEGVPAEQVDAIFEAFRRGEGATGPGVGLGLYLVKTLAEAQGGSVAVAEREGGGAEFTVRLPLTGSRAVSS